MQQDERDFTDHADGITLQISRLHVQHQQLLPRVQHNQSIIQPQNHQLSQNKQRGPKVRTACKLAISTCEAGRSRIKSRVSQIERSCLKNIKLRFAWGLSG